MCMSGFAPDFGQVKEDLNLVLIRENDKYRTMVACFQEVLFFPLGFIIIIVQLSKFILKWLIINEH